MSLANPLVANTLVGPIDRTAASPVISFGGDQVNSSGTGIYGDFASVRLAVAASNLLSLTAQGLFLANDICIFSGATAPVDGTTGDNFAGPGSLYIALDTGALYRQTSAITTPVWAIFESGDSPLAQPLTGFVAGAGTVAAADTILQGFNKLAGNTQNRAVTANLLTGLAAGAATPIAAGDTILVALANLQAQIDAL